MTWWRRKRRVEPEPVVIAEPEPQRVPEPEPEPKPEPEPEPAPEPAPTPDPEPVIEVRPAPTTKRKGELYVNGQRYDSIDDIPDPVLREHVRRSMPPREHRSHP